MFNENEEKALAEHVIHAAKLFHELSKLQVRQLAYEYAKALGKKHPKSWENNKVAGDEWLAGFRKRSGRISLRHPEATSLACSMGFNRVAVTSFFENYSSLRSRFPSIGPQSVWNLNETGVSTVVKPRQVLAEKGIKQVGRKTAAERGTTVTICCCINGIGNALPPVFVFPRVHFRDYMLHGAPPGSVGFAVPSGWMNSDLFPKALQHFIEQMFLLIIQRFCF